MLYSEFLIKSKDLCIEQADNGLFYLVPEWHSILIDNGLNLKMISGTKAGWDNIEDVLKLEVEKRNTINSNKPYVLNWLYELLTTQIEPTMLQEETDYIKQVTEFMKTNHELRALKEEQE